MRNKKKGAPSENETPKYANDTIRKGTAKIQNNLLGPSRLKILNILLSGEKVSVVDLTTRLKMSDPRSGIRDLKNAGHNVQSYWTNSGFSKHKIYFIHNQDIATYPTNERERKDEKK